MRIAIGSLQCEGNSLTPIHTRREDFDFAAGEDMYEKIRIWDLLEGKQAEIIPTIYAHALPGGQVVLEDFLQLAQELVDGIPAEGLDGVWLYLHGAMCVEQIGSGEEYLLRKVREKVGPKIPISVAMDFHADNSDAVPELCNCITGFRTAPHTDHFDAQLRAMRALFVCMEKHILPRPQLERASVVICGDAVQTDLEPLKSIMDEARKMEEELPGMLAVQVFNGQPWIDEPYMGPNFVVTHESDPDLARTCAAKLARMFYDARHDFRFLIETAEPEEAVRLAMEDQNEMVFLSDSGDNTTAGASGDNAFMINRLREAGASNVLIAGIADEEACELCYNASIGDTLTLQVGGRLDSESESTVITGKLIHRGNIISYTGGDGGPTATLDCGDMTVVVTRSRAALCRQDIFDSIELDFRKFHIIVVKLGYLFPDLAKAAPRSILVFTPGSSAERLEDMHLKRIRRPMFPLDDYFM